MATRKEEHKKIFDVVEYKFQEFLKCYPQDHTDETMRELSEALELELTDREIKLVRACENQFQERLERFTRNFLYETIDLTPYGTTRSNFQLTVEDVVKAREITDNWDKLNAAIAANPTTKKQWDELMFTLRLSQK